MYRIDNSDLARSMILRRQVSDLKTATERHSTEMTLGRTVDPGQKLRGDFTALSGFSARSRRSKATRPSWRKQTFSSPRCRTRWTRSTT
jgi:hypothetical protein